MMKSGRRPMKYSRRIIEDKRCFLKMTQPNCDDRNRFLNDDDILKVCVEHSQNLKARMYDLY